MYLGPLVRIEGYQSGDIRAPVDLPNGSQRQGKAARCLKHHADFITRPVLGCPHDINLRFKTATNVRLQLPPILDGIAKSFEQFRFVPPRLCSVFSR